MSHEIDFTAGDAAFVEIGDHVSAWHQLGRSVASVDLEGLTGEQKIDLILKEGRLDWTVDPYGVSDETGTFLNGWSAFKRSDTGKVMGVFRSSYTILQNKELFTLIEPLLDSGIADFETAGAIHEGEDVWALLRFNPNDPAVKDYFGENGIIPFALLANNHSYKRLVTIQETMIRVVCKNTLSAATGMFGRKRRKAGRYPGAILLKHSKNVKSMSVDAVTELWGTITERYAAVKDGYELLKKRFLTEEEFESAVLDVLAPLPTDPDSKQFESTLLRAETKRELVTTLYRGDALGTDGSPTAWNAYQATTEALDHSDLIFPTKGERLAAIYPGGSLANKKQDVLNNLFALSQEVK